MIGELKGFVCDFDFFEESRVGKENRIKNDKLQCGEEYFTETLFERAGGGGKNTSTHGSSKQRCSADCDFIEGRCELGHRIKLQSMGCRSLDVQQLRRDAQALHFFLYGV